MNASSSLALRASAVVLYAISFVASLVGNTFFLYIIYKKPYTRTTISFLFVNLAVADLVVTLIAMPDSTAFYFRSDKWPGGVAGDILCRTVRFSFALAIAAAIFTLAAMTLNGFIAVVYPMRAPEYYSRPRKSTIVIWLSSIVLMSHRLLTYSTAQNGDCKDDWSLFQTDNWTGLIIWCVLYFAFLFILPVILMAVFYSIMCNKLYHQEIPGEIANVQVARIRREQNRKVVKLLISIVVVFILCWVPVQAMHLLWVLKKTTPPYVMFLCFWCGHSHSAINPWMYLYLNAQFRRAFLEIIGNRP